MASAADDFDGPEPGLEDADVVTKYKMAGEMSNRVLKLVMENVKAGATVLSLCKLGDEAIMKEVATVYNKKVEGAVTPKGIAFPTCVSLNNCVCHNSPLSSDAEIVLKDGDVVKIDLGIHIDGFIAPVATTVVVGASKDKPVTGPKADVIAAAYTACEVALRLIKPGVSTAAVTAALNSIGADFSCSPIENMLSHQLTQNVIDGAKAIISNPSDQFKKEHKESIFEVNEVYALDVFMSTGDGKVKPGEQRTTVFKKTDNKYLLKMQASRALISEVNKNFNYMPFTLRMLKEENKAKLGVTECVAHQVLQPYDLLWEQEGAFVAQFKVLVLLMPNGTLRVTSGSFDPEVIKTEKALQSEEFKKLLAVSVGAKSKKKSKKTGAKKEGDAAAAADGKDEE